MCLVIVRGRRARAWFWHRAAWNAILRPATRSQDTITGFLLAGVGNVDLRKKRNYLVVDASEFMG